MGTIRKSDYTITFNDAQDLELIGRKMMKASLILKSNADIGRSWNVKLGNLGQRLGQERFSGSQEAMQEYITELERHARVVDSLLDRLAGTSKLVRDIAMLDESSYTEFSTHCPYSSITYLNIETTRRLSRQTPLFKITVSNSKC